MSAALGLALIAAASSARAEPSRESAIIAVFPIEDARRSGRIPVKELGDLTEYLAAKLAEGSLFKVVPRQDLKKAIEQKKKESYKACYSTECQIEIGKEVAAEKSLSTKIILISGSRCSVVSQLYDLRTSVTDRSASSDGGCDRDAVAEGLLSVIAKLKGRDAGERGERDAPAPGRTASPHVARGDTGATTLAPPFVRLLFNEPGVELVAVWVDASWSAPAILERDEWRALHEYYRAKGLRIVVVMSQDPTCMSESPVWRGDQLLCDEPGAALRLLGGSDPPAAWLWKSDGTILVQGGTVDEVEAAVRRTLK